MIEVHVTELIVVGISMGFIAFVNWRHSMRLIQKIEDLRDENRNLTEILLRRETAYENLRKMISVDL